MPTTASLGGLTHSYELCVKSSHGKEQAPTEAKYGSEEETSVAKRTRVPAAQRERVLARDDYSCTICGVPAYELHHINGDASDHRPDNLVTLCPTCHQWRVHRVKELTEEDLKHLQTALSEDRAGLLERYRTELLHISQLQSLENHLWRYQHRLGSRW